MPVIWGGRPPVEQVTQTEPPKVGPKGFEGNEIHEYNLSAPSGTTFSLFIETTTTDSHIEVSLKVDGVAEPTIVMPNKMMLEKSITGEDIVIAVAAVDETSMYTAHLNDTSVISDVMLPIPNAE